jgi:hypothetical protein
MRLNQKANSKTKFRIQTIVKSIRISFSSGIQNSGPSLVKNVFFLAIRCNEDHASQISSKSKVLKNFGQFLSKFNS